MLEKFIKSYYKLFDEKLENGTLIVLIITLVIILAGTLIQNKNIPIHWKNNILESQGNYELLYINGRMYKVTINK